jgi:hypothetical protein
VKGREEKGKEKAKKGKGKKKNGKRRVGEIFPLTPNMERGGGEMPEH